MTKQEAIQAMKAGIKVCHPSFMENEFIVMAGVCTIETEEGYQHNADDFWAYRTHENFEKGWEIWDESIVEEAEESFECCVVCDLPDECNNFGCAISNGYKIGTAIR